MTERETTTTVTERPVEPVHTHTTVIERKSGGGSGIMMALLLLIVVVGGFFAWQFLQQGEVRTDAVAGAANEVGDAAQKVGDAAQDAAQKIGE
ncbi:hypothetical protein [Blastomonas sp. SL216]|uniref:hypothetical protein n=1 Tax=Blastomonas sp. SL216 TaxID=2995169 RepID=UPI002376D1BB|nr:hypothetical protein OU999_16325 [Blastomonas sp. SL216]